MVDRELGAHLIEDRSSALIAHGVAANGLVVRQHVAAERQIARVLYGAALRGQSVRDRKAFDGGGGPGGNVEHLGCIATADGYSAVAGAVKCNRIGDGQRSLCGVKLNGARQAAGELHSPRAGGGIGLVQFVAQ